MNRGGLNASIFAPNKFTDLLDVEGIPSQEADAPIWSTADQKFQFTNIDEYQQSDTAYALPATNNYLFVYDNPVINSGLLKTLRFAQPILSSTFSTQIVICEKSSGIMAIKSITNVTVNSKIVDLTSLNIQVIAGQYVGLVAKTGLYNIIVRGNINTYTFAPANIVVGKQSATLVVNKIEYDYSFEVQSDNVINRLIDIEETLNRKVKLFLPSTLTVEVGKQTYIFKNSITDAFNYRNYNIQFILAANATYGADYDRYWVYNALVAGTNAVTVKLFDNNRVLLDTKTVLIVAVNRTTQPDSMKTVLFIGNSLTYYNRLSDEFYRVLTSSDVESTVADTISIYNTIKFAGRGWGNIQLIGTQKNNWLGWTGLTYHEGRSGWAWSNFIGASSPFYYSGALNFAHYLSANGFTQPDIVYVGLGWNDTTIIIGETYDVSTIIANARTFLTAMRAAWPTTKIRLWTENVPGVHGGIGAHVYGSTEWVDEQRLKKQMLILSEAYKVFETEITDCRIVQSTAQIDSEYALQELTVNVNSRIAFTETRGKDYVHPADAGFFQIADSIIADFCNSI